MIYLKAQHLTHLLGTIVCAITITVRIYMS